MATMPQMVYILHPNDGVTTPGGAGESGPEGDDLPEPDVRAVEIAEDLQTALNQFAALVGDLKKKSVRTVEDGDGKEAEVPAGGRPLRVSDRPEASCRSNEGRDSGTGRAAFARRSAEL